VLAALEQLPPGRYLLRCAGDESVIVLLRAQDLGDAGQPEALQLERAARLSAGATDAESLDFVPMRWQARCCAVGTHFL
jgi:hypothetical protein